MIILASTSQTRQRLLRAAGLDFEAHQPTTDENIFKHNHPHLMAADLARALARAKAESLRALFEDAVIIGCDQVLSCENRIFEKPKSASEALEHLSFLQGKTHTLHTAVCCVSGTNPRHEFISEPNLTMRSLSRPYLEAYLDKVGPEILHCVGCYQIEALGVQLFNTMDGDVFSIQGLPLLPLLVHLRASGYIAT